MMMKRLHKAKESPELGAVAGRDSGRTGLAAVLAFATLLTLTATTGCVPGQTDDPAWNRGAVCGNKSCEEGENATNCAVDCGGGVVTAVCGNGKCETGETETACPADCQGVVVTCGNNNCEPGESNASCPADCPLDSVCKKDEECGVSANACLKNVCSAGKCGTAQQTDGTFCDDGNACTKGEGCAAGKCVGGVAPDCNDDKPCTVDTCDKTKGCEHQAGSEGQSCSEALDGICAGGACKAQACASGYDPVEVDDGGIKKTACAAYEPVWGNRPDKPAGVYAVSEPVSGAGKVVVDSQTKLMWQQATAPNKLSWQNAKDYCEALSYAGFKDWRLPSSVELETLADYSIAGPEPTIDQSAFPGTKPNWYWSASLRAGSSSEAWRVDFYYGYVVNFGFSDTGEVRCVRGS